MRIGSYIKQLLGTVLTLALLLPCSSFAANDQLNWNDKGNSVSADITSWDLPTLLENIAVATGWKVYLEPNLQRNVSAKFDKLPSGEALRSLLGNLNYVVMPATNGVTRLYVFRTTQDQATRLISGKGAKKSAKSKRIPNELIVTLKPGSKTKIEDLAKALGAKVVGRLDDMNTYRLQFEDEESAQLARQLLENNPDVESVDSNYYVERPATPELSDLLAGDLQLKFNTNSGGCQLVIGLIDTSLSKVPKELEPFFLPPISVAGDANNSPDTLTHADAMSRIMLEMLEKITSGNTKVKVQPIDVFGPNENSNLFDIAKGLAAATNTTMINMSLGSDADSQLLHKLVTQAKQQNVPIFAAAGNTPVTTPTFPAAYPEVNAVTAGDRNGQLASYANRGSFVDMVAPGTSRFNFNGKTYQVEGTSGATAYTTALAAGLADVNNACADQAVSLLKSSAQGSLKMGSSQ